MNNGYPPHTIDLQLDPNPTAKPAPWEPTTTISLPFVEKLTDNIRRYLKQFGIRVVARSSMTLGNQLMRKSPHLPQGERNGVVYCIPCKDCNGVYIGESGQRLKTRVAEHRAATAKGYILTDEKGTGVSDHVVRTGHTIDWDNVQILCFEQDYKKRKIKESLFINCHSTCYNHNSQRGNICPSWLILRSQLY